MRDDIFAIVIGAGPAGLGCARALARGGKKVVLIDANPVGGVCLNNGCIPTKFRLARLNTPLQELLPKQRKVVNDMVSAIENSMSRIGVEIVYGFAKLLDKNVVEVEGRQFKAEHIILAIGSSPRELNGITIDNERVFFAEEMLWKEGFPDYSGLNIIGAGPIGIEFAFMMRPIFEEIIVRDVANEILPSEDKDIASRLRAVMRKQGIKFELGKPADISDLDGVVLIGIGRNPNKSSSALLNGIDIKRDNRGFIKTDANFMTSVEGIYAIGECRGAVFLANPASFDGKQLAGILLGRKAFPLEVVPRCVFSNPVACFVGKMADNLSYGEAAFPHGEMRLIYPVSGKMKIGVDDKNIVKYAAVLGPGAAELASFFELAIKKRVSFDELRNLLYVHPTVSEAIARVKFK